MASGYYLLDHPNPHKKQYRLGRRAAVNGQITLHTAESVLDIIGPDSGAESVAAFIAGRRDYGSYHLIGDRDSIVAMAPFSYEVWHDATRYSDGTRANSRSIGISLAMRADDWPKLSAEHRRELLNTMVIMATMAAAWYRDEHGIIVPAVGLTKLDSDEGRPGFIGHGQRDPGRRSDPGSAFPWAEFLDLFADRFQGGPMPADRTAQISEWQRTLLDHGANLGTTGLNNDGVDGDFGPLTLNASKTVLSILTDQVAHWSSEAERLQGEMDDLEAGKLSTEDARLVENLAAFIRHTMSEAT